VPAEPLLTCSIVVREGLGAYDRLEQGVCIAWALLGNEFSIVVEGLDMVLFIYIKMMHGPIRIRFTCSQIFELFLPFNGAATSFHIVTASVILIIRSDHALSFISISYLLAILINLLVFRCVMGSKFVFSPPSPSQLRKCFSFLISGVPICSAWNLVGRRVGE